MIDELRLGPTQSDYDKIAAHRETEDKINELVRQLNEDPTFYTRVEVDQLLVGLGGGGSVDLSAYLTTEQIASIYATIEQLDGKADAVHDHDTRYYTEAESDSLFAPVAHIHDDRYYTEVESDARFAALVHNHDDRYYTESEADARFAAIGHTHPASQITPGTFGAGDYVFPADVIADVIRRDTLDAADNERLLLTGGGAVSTTRGAIIEICGNEHSQSGQILLRAGYVSGGAIRFFTESNIERVRISTAGAVAIGSSDLAWGDVWRLLQLGVGGAIVGHTSVGFVGLLDNAYFETTNALTGAVYRNAGAASYFSMAEGALTYRVAGSGAAGAFITWASVLSIASSGALSIFVGGALKAVTEGAADSGGLGFKALRVPN